MSQSTEAVQAVEWFTKHYGVAFGCLIVTWPVNEEIHKGNIEVAHTNTNPTEEALGIATMGLTRLANSIYESRKETDI